MVDGLEAAHSSGAMNTTEQKKRIILGEKKRSAKNISEETPKTSENKK